jgi:hypothetical protein
MAPRSKPPGDGPDRDTETPEPRTGTSPPPADVEPNRRDSPSIPQPDDAPGAPVERSEDFGGRKDIETADEPVEEHDRRHHGRDVESRRPTPSARP